MTMRCWIALLLVGCYEPEPIQRCEIGCTDLCPDDMTCNAELRCVPENDTEPCVTTTSKCPAGYQPLGPGTSMYRFVASAPDMVMAAMDCADDDKVNNDVFTHLVVISDPDELNALSAVPARAAELVIGHNDKFSPNIYISITREDPLYIPRISPYDEPWASGEPSEPAERCVAIGADGQIYGVRCDFARAFVCECDQYADEPARYVGTPVSK